MIPSAHTIVLTADRSGSGKTTTAMHVAIGLLRLGYKVATLDLDARQSTLTQYMVYRVTHTALQLPSPAHLSLEKSAPNLLDDQDNKGSYFLVTALEELSPHFDFIVIDTAARHTPLSRLALSRAHTLMTFLSDQTADDLQTETVHNAHRIGLHSHLSQSGRRDGVLGFTDRAIFPDLFSKGLTLLDLKETPDSPITMPLLAARQEVRQLIRAINPQALKGYPQKRRNSQVNS